MKMWDGPCSWGGVGWVGLHSPYCVNLPQNVSIAYDVSSDTSIVERVFHYFSILFDNFRYL